MPLHALDNLSNLTNPAAAATALGVGTTDAPTFAGLNAVGNGVTTTTLGADGRQSWFLNNSGVAAGQISYSSPGGEPGISIIRGTGRSDIRAVAGMGIAIASYSSGSGAPAEQFRFSLAGNMLVGTTSETGLASGGLRTSGNAIIGGTFTVTGASTFGGLIEQRNGLNAQESRIYGTYTDGSNYRRLALKMSSAGVAQIVAEGAGSGSAGNVLQLPSNTTFADAAATRTALGFDAAVPKIPILFSNSSDFTTPSTSFVSVTGLSFPVAANKNYQVSFHLNTNKNDANGIQYQITGPASPTRVFGRVILFTSSTSTSAADIPTAFNAASTTFNTFSGDSLAFSSPAIIISNGANAGTVQIQIRAVTGGTAKIYAGSWLQITEL